MSDTSNRVRAIAVLDEVQGRAYPSWATGEYLMTALEDAHLQVFEESFDGLVEVARQLLADHYPADIFDGSSGDPGPVFVAKLREALEVLP